MHTGKQTYLNAQKGADREADIFKYSKGCRQGSRHILILKRVQTGMQTYLNTQKGADREADIFKYSKVVQTGKQTYLKYPKGCRQGSRHI